jgi:cytochrome c biogenesis protein CcdA
MNANLALAFSAGMVATVNPCGFAMLPAYLSYFLGLEDRCDHRTRRHRRAGPSAGGALAVSAAVTAGFLVVFGIMGFAWSSVSGLIGAAAVLHAGGRAGAGRARHRHAAASSR